jgi:hypothetical protein
MSVTPAPTEKQYGYLRALASGAAIVIGGKRETEMYLRRGWVTAEWRDEKQYPYAWIRITPEGLRALAVAVEKYGLPDLGPKPVSERRVCTDCGSTRYHYKRVEHDREAA